jgi:hypothetical protein
LQRKLSVYRSILFDQLYDTLLPTLFAFFINPHPFYSCILHPLTAFCFHIHLVAMIDDLPNRYDAHARKRKVYNACVHVKSMFINMLSSV